MSATGGERACAATRRVLVDLLASPARREAAIRDEPAYNAARCAAGSASAALRRPPPLRCRSSLVDGGLVALAYYLAFALRFDRGIPQRYERPARRPRSPWVVVVALVVFALFGLYAEAVALLGQRDYERSLQAVVVTTLASPARSSRHQAGRDVRAAAARSRVSLPTGVVALFFLLLLVLTGGARFLVARGLRAPAARLPRRARTRATC